MSFKVVTYNILATAYLEHGEYQDVSPEVLDPEWRIPALARHIAAMKADVVCLQEVEADAYDAVRAALPEHDGLIEFKGRSKPDGCATFYRRDRFTRLASRRLGFTDNEIGPGAHSGFVALMLALTYQGRSLGVVNTHLRWTQSGTPKEQHIGYRQATELLAACEAFTPRCDGWLVCGDFNSKPKSDVVSAFIEAGFAYAHAGRADVHSAVMNKRTSLIDHIFFSPQLLAMPIDPPAVTAATILPSHEEPSDHLPIAAELEWCG